MKYLIISHGHFADGLKESIEMIAGPSENLSSLCLLGDMAPDSFYDEILEYVKDGGQTFVFVDLLGGTPFNTLIRIIKEYENVSFVTGANLAMCLGVITDDSVITLEEAVALAKE